MTNPVAPPPYGQNGDVPPPAAGFAPPGAPVPPGGYPPPPPGGYPPPPQAKSKGKVVAIVGAIVVGLVVLFLKFGLGYLLSSDKTADAAVGTCFTSGEKAEDMKIIDCGAATAVHKVIGKVDGVKEAAFNADQTLSLCQQYPTTEAEYWSEGKFGKSYLLCLEPLKK